MSRDERPTTEFGCFTCWPADARAAWEAHRSLDRTVLVGRTHFEVEILECPDCAQRILYVYTELIDFSGGNDPQYWNLLPITDDEARELIPKGRSQREDELVTLGPDRPSLRAVWPSSADEKSVFWATGLLIPAHD